MTAILRDTLRRPARRRRARILAVLALLVGVPGAQARGQSVLERPPNLGGSWLAQAGTLHFNFVHRFTSSPAPERKITNSPTFLVAARAPAGATVGLSYATNSDVVRGIPNEWEVFSRIATGSDDDRTGAAGLQMGYNFSALSVDGELALSKRVGGARIFAVARGFSNAYDAGRARVALGGGAVVRLRSWLGLGGDVASLLQRRGDEEPAWSGGVQLGMPGTPHSLSVHVTNTNTTTLEGVSRGTSTIRYGFEYTIPVHMARFRSPSTAPRQPSPAGGSGPATAPLAFATPADTVWVPIRNLAYGEPRLEVSPGTVVVWVNRDPVVHTVTADDGSFDSGDIAPERSWSFRFTQTGAFSIHCTPHPFMRTTVVVR